jgi:UDP-2,4-diacetamido-2,4,6-trideoxy-beta-L-altropyranose hydrolase
MRVDFRVDASEVLGAGHLVRCLVLADAVAARGGRSRLFLRDLNPYAGRILSRSAHEVIALGSTDMPWRTDQDVPDWLVVDHYGLDAGWERRARVGSSRVLVIDDLADRPHDCDLLVDPGLGRRAEDYAPWVDRRTQLLLGSQYAILKPVFAAFHGAAPVWPAVRRVHVFFGGGSPVSWLPAHVGAVLDALPAVRVMAIGFGEESAMSRLLAQHGERLQWRSHVEEMAIEYAGCDVAIGSPGTATWERACVGLPSGLVATARNQVPILRGLEHQGLCRFLGPAWEFEAQTFQQRVQTWIQDEDALRAMRALGVASVDGRGAQRIVEALFARGGGDG